MEDDKFVADFTYIEPGIGEIEIEGNEHDYSSEEIVKLIEERYPEYEDIEVIS